jgi:hypothetical protein
MTDPTSYLLSEPPTQPKPTPGCVICANLTKQRIAAKAAGDYSLVSDCNVGLRAHGKHAPTSR